MIKLFFTPGACSMAVHIVLREAGVAFELEQVDLVTKVTSSNDDFSKINPKGYVPALQLENGKVLSEVAMVMQYLADQAPTANLIAKQGTVERYRQQEWLNFIATELHKTLGALFIPAITAEWKAAQIDTFSRRSNYLSQQLTRKKFLAGDRFTVADAYLFTVLSWTTFHNVDMSAWPSLTDYMARISERAAVVKTLKAEGLA